MILFVNDILKSEYRNIEFTNFKVFFSMFSVKILAFCHFLSKFNTFSRPGNVNDKIPGFQSIPGRVGTPNYDFQYLSDGAN